ncbi:hypothetical protein SteCoe_5978 [Stentor coeruleus]|uniref:Uncharacterized protein n=1 Tax=Stentor coeruleus TaxID=5963 RepID=A0A1R2CR67_9CILI|nr:hypothetical protein SteCoe_5978 [Stentor coeruleus]
MDICQTDISKNVTREIEEIVITSRSVSPKNFIAHPTDDNTHEELNELARQFDGSKYKCNLTLALPTKFSSVCWISKYPQGEYIVDWKTTSAVCETITKKELSEYCEKISNYSLSTFGKIKRSKKIFHLGLVALFLIILMTLGIILIFKAYWLAIIDCGLIVTWVFCCFNYISRKLEAITKDLKAYIKKHNLEYKHIKTKIGKYGTFLSFRLMIS